MATRTREQDVDPAREAADGTPRRTSRRRRRRTLVVVETPAKARTLRRLLGKGDAVRATGGALMALADSGMAVVAEQDFAPRSALLPGKEEVLAGLREAAQRVDTVLLATDPDEEGDALALQLAEALAHPDVRRLRLASLAPAAVEEALQAPSPLARAPAEAHLARELLERVFTEEASPLLPREVRRGLALGRMPSLALRLLVERRQTREAAAWTVEAVLQAEGGAPFRARLAQVAGAPAAVEGRAQAEALAHEARGAPARVVRVEARERSAPAPLDPATLLEEAAARLGLTARRTMALARRLYEGLPLGEEGHLGLITFPRGEAIRPVSAAHPPERLQPLLGQLEGGELLALYALIWAARGAVDGERTVEVEAGRLLFRGTVGPVEAGQPPLAEGAVLQVRDVRWAAEPRDTDGTLARALVAHGLGRADTLVPALAALHERRAVETVDGQLVPTAAAVACLTALRQHFPRELDAAEAAALEARLLRVAAGGEDWRAVLRDFLAGFKAEVARAEARVREAQGREDVPTDVPCDKCGSPMVIRFGKTGPFLACSTYPECRATRDFKEVDGRIVPLAEGAADGVCEKCGRPMRVKQGRYGMYLACEGYPECHHTRPVSIGVACPECKEGALSERRSRRGKVFFGCTRYPDCTFVAWDRPLAEACPRCGSPYLVQKLSRREGPSAACPDRACGYRRALERGPGPGTPSVA